ncbi:hypothetical protein EMCRGX_G014696 [Ephydatia muelleri]
MASGDGKDHFFSFTSSAACAAPHRMEMVLSGLVAASLLSTCDAIFTSSLEEHSTCMSCRSTMMIGGAGFSADGNKGAKWHFSHQKASTDSATFLELVSVEFHLGLCDRTKQLQVHYS